MGIGVSVFLIAVGAILAFAVEVSTQGIDLDVVGAILMVVGFAGLLFSLLYFSPWSPGRDRETIIEREHTHSEVGHARGTGRGRTVA